MLLFSSITKYNPEHIIPISYNIGYQDGVTHRANAEQGSDSRP